MKEFLFSVLLIYAALMVAAKPVAYYSNAIAAQVSAGLAVTR